MNMSQVTFTSLFRPGGLCQYVQLACRPEYNAGSECE